MNSDKQIIRIDLTTSQKEQLRATIGREADAIELTVKELEERIVPGLNQNHNETFLLENPCEVTP